MAEGGSGFGGRVAPGLVAALLPGIACVETDQRGDVEDLYPEEAAVVARAVDKRRREFAAVRRCARLALHRLGVPPVAILPGEHGAPVWPEGIVGSMSHCAGYAAAAVARAEVVAAIGLDVEEHAPLPEGVLDLIAHDDEAAWVRALGTSRSQVNWDRLLFSAKESVYKAWFPLTGLWLDFRGARVFVEPQAKTFTAELTVPGPVIEGSQVTRFHGRWNIAAGVIATAIVLPRP